MYDTTYVMQGGVYEVLDRYGNVLDKLYMVVSDDTYNAMSGFVMVATIEEVTDTEFSRYHAQFDLISNRETTPMHICGERIFNVTKNRLGRYKFTLSREIQREVLKKIMLTLTGETLYTLPEAICELHNIEMNKRVEAVTSINLSEASHDVKDENIVMELEEEDDEKLSAEDRQKIFAMKMKGQKDIYEEPLPKPILQPVEVAEEIEEPIVEEAPTELVMKTISPKKTAKPKKGGDMGHHGGSSPDPKYAHVYSHKEDFLLDYYSMTKDEVAEKWGLESGKVVANRAYACRQMLIREGFDMTYFNQLSQEHTSEMKKCNGNRKHKVDKMPAI